MDTDLHWLDTKLASERHCSHWQRRLNLQGRCALCCTYAHAFCSFLLQVELILVELWSCTLMCMTMTAVGSGQKGCGDDDERKRREDNEGDTHCTQVALKSV